MTHYIPSNEKDEKEILDTLEISSFEDLIKIIPKKFLKQIFLIANIPKSITGKLLIQIIIK